MTTGEVRALLERIPKETLGFFPTPCYKLERLSKELGVNLYIKRDDFSGMSLFGGNKIRKLEYLMGDARAKGCDYVFTFGATQSNHAMQTVTACRKCGLKPILYLTAVVEPDERDIRSNMLLDFIMGAELHVVRLQEGETEEDAEERAVMLAREHRKRLEAEGHRCYEIPMGGASEVGTLGFIEGYAEFSEQLSELGIHADFIFHATGTGGTMAGLHAGRKLLNSDTQIVSVSVSAKTPEYSIQKAALANQTLALLGAADVCVNADDMFIEQGYYAPGYELPNEAASEAIRLLARKEGLLVDPVYTGKAFAGMLDYIRSGRAAQGSNVIFWHTGGATALFAEKEILGDIF